MAVDIGNTDTVLGIYDGEKLVHDFRIESAPRRTRDELHVLLRSLIELAGSRHSEIRASIVASVVPSLTERMVDAVDQAFDHDMLVVGPGIKTGMAILIDNPKEVGADRIVNAIAAYQRIGDAVIVVDFGTATTLDCISKKGEYLGGAIAPGLQISADALFTRAAKLPRVELQYPPSPIGTNTIHSMQSGLLFGYVALVDGLVDRIRKELPNSRVIATGGLASLVAPESRTIEEVDEFLTLEGLRILYERNS